MVKWFVLCILYEHAILTTFYGLHFSPCSLLLRRGQSTKNLVSNSAPFEDQRLFEVSCYICQQFCNSYPWVSFAGYALTSWLKNRYHFSNNFIFYTFIIISIITTSTLYTFENQLKNQQLTPQKLDQNLGCQLL